MDAPSILGGRATPEEQARAIVAWILSTPPGSGAYSGQTPALLLQQAQHIRGARGQGRRGQRSERGDRNRRRRGRGEGEGNTRNTLHPRITSSSQRAGQTSRREVHPAEDRGEETDQDTEGAEVGGGRDIETPRVPLVEVTRIGGDATALEGDADLPRFTPERAHLLLQRVSGRTWTGES